MAAGGIKMTKRELDLLEKVFQAQLEGRLFQTRSKLAKQMDEDGYIMADKKTLGVDCFGQIIVRGYILTVKGNYAYCTSDRCKGE